MKIETIQEFISATETVNQIGDLGEILARHELNPDLVYVILYGSALGTDIKSPHLEPLLEMAPLRLRQFVTLRYSDLVRRNVCGGGAPLSCVYATWVNDLETAIKAGLKFTIAQQNQQLQSAKQCLANGSFSESQYQEIVKLIYEIPIIPEP